MRLFVGGLSFRSDDEALSRTFKEFGQVLEARIALDRDTGRSRGFGFVTMSTREEGAAAIRGMYSKELDGRTVRVSEAQERAPRRSLPGTGDKD